MTLNKNPFENIVGKGENTGNQHFLLFPHCLLPFPNTNFNFSVTSILSRANAFNLDQYIILLFGKELSSDRPNTLWEKEKEQVTSIFPFSDYF